MKTLISSLTLLLILLVVSPIETSAQAKKDKNAPKKEKSEKKTDKGEKKNLKSEKIMLFNGKNLENWVFQLKDASVDPATVFTVQNGVIHITGNPFGYMRTKETYENYSLHVEWRYPTELTNSGVFVHAQKPDTIWPRLVEVQLKAGNAGDFVLMNGADMNRSDKSSRVIKKLTESNEKPVGEWNYLDVKCLGNIVEVSVNGISQNKGTGLNISQGSICLQSEGKDIEFRNVYLTKLKTK